MTGVVPIIPRFKFFDEVGNPLALGWVTFYEAGTTTLANTYQDKGLTSANSNPKQLDANGECLLWVDSAKTYKILLQKVDLSTVPGYPVDNIPGTADIGAAVAAAQEWATKTDAAVDGSLYSAKEYAQGTQASTGGSAKNWAQQTGADVTGATANSRSSKSWAQDNLAGATLGGSSKDWAQSASSPDGTSQSAKTYASNAAASATTAQTAAAAALAAGRIYVDTATGLAAVASGEYFCVPTIAGSNDILILYLDNAGVAVEQGRFPSSVLVAADHAQMTLLADDGVYTDSIGQASPGAGASAFAGQATLVFTNPLPRNCRLMKLVVTANASGTMKIKRYTRSANTLTWQSEVSVSVTAGAPNTYGPDVLTALEFQAGDYVGLMTPVNVLKYNVVSPNFVQYVQAAGDNTTTITYAEPTTTNQVQARIDFYGKVDSLLEVDSTAQKVAALFDELGVTTTMGATTPADQASTLAVGTTFFVRETNPEPGIISEVAVYSKIAGEAWFVVVKPNGAGSMTLLHKRRVSLSAAATTTLSIADGTLPVLKVPRGCRYGFQALTASSIAFNNTSLTAEGYLAATGEITGTVGQFTLVYGRELQCRVKVISGSLKRKVADAQPRYLTDIDITTAGALPAMSKSAGMSYSGGYAVSSATGLSSSYIEGIYSGNESRAKARVRVRGTSGTAKIAIYRRPVYGLSSVDDGTVAYFDISTNAIAICAPWGGSGVLPADATGGSKTCGFTIPQNVDLIAELTCDNKSITFKLTNPLTGANDSITVSSDGTDLAGLCHGVAGCAVLAGTGSVKSVSLHSLIYEPTDLIIGDSKVEGSGTTQANSYPNLASAALGGKAVVMGDGGITTDAALRQLYDVIPSYPSLRRVWWDLGTNNATAGAGGVTNYQNETTLAMALCTAYGVDFIALCQPPRNDANQVHVTSINTWIVANTTRPVRRDLRNSSGNDGVTWLTGVMNDSLHENTTGHANVFDQMKIDRPEPFDMV